MSMNIRILGKRDIVWKGKDGVEHTDQQVIEFDALQTPTEVTKEILKSSRPYEAYKTFVKETLLLSVDLALEHLREFDYWLYRAHKQGYEIYSEEC